MNLNVEIPDDLAQRLGAGGDDLSRRALEGFAVEEYKAGRLTKPELRRLLGFDTRYELDGFLKAHGVWMNYTIDDLRREVDTLERLGISKFRHPGDQSAAHPPRLEEK
jgi:Uncharacterised protein family (UPF0175)